MRRDRSPIPPPREPKRDPYALQREREMDRRPPLRRRSPSPPYKRRRSPDDFCNHRHERFGSPPRGPYRGRSPDFGRYEDYDPYYGGPPPPRHMGQPPPPPGRRPAGGRSGAGGGVPKTFKQFLLDEVPENVTPQEAQVLYEQYLTDHFGSQLRAKFEQEKQHDDVRARFHPSAFEASLVRHREEAAAEAAVLAAAVRDKALDPAAPDFNQGRGAEAGGGADGGAREGPVCLWAPARVANDLKVARTLVALVDSQRGLRLADNPLLPPAADAGGMAAMATDGQEGADGTANGEGGAAARGGDAAAGEVAANGGGDGSQQQQQQQQQEGQQAPALLRGVLDAIDAEEVSCEGEQALQECLGQLDLLLTWLWRVHGIDYYGGRELLTEAQYGGRHSSSRTLRPPRPEEGEEQDEEEAKADQERLAREVDAVWQARLGAPDPLLAAAQREEIERRLTDWVESQIHSENEKKWGSTFSGKFFLEKRFVVKHIYNKHGAKLDERRGAIRDELYWEAYEAAKSAVHAAERATQQQRDAAAAAAQAAAAGAGDEDGGEEWQEGEGGRGRGRGRGRGGMPRGGRGRGGAHGMFGELPIVDASMMMMGGLPGPIILPGPGMMGGALPLGAPMVLDPSMLAGADMGGVPLFLPPGGGRGAPGLMRGGGGGMMLRGGRGGRGARGGPHGKQYYDLDAPANNRAVLDYGDL